MTKSLELKKKNCYMKKNYSIIIKTSVAQFYMVNNEGINFQKMLCTYFLEHVSTKS